MIVKKYYNQTISFTGKDDGNTYGIPQIHHPKTHFNRMHGYDFMFFHRNLLIK